MVFLASMADAVGQDRFARRRAFRGAERGAASPPRAMGRFHGSDKSDLRDGALSHVAKRYAALQPSA